MSVIRGQMLAPGIDFRNSPTAYVTDTRTREACVNRAFRLKLILSGWYDILELVLTGFNLLLSWAGNVTARSGQTSLRDSFSLTTVNFSRRRHPPR